MKFHSQNNSENQYSTDILDNLKDEVQLLATQESSLSADSNTGAFFGVQGDAFVSPPLSLSLPHPSFSLSFPRSPSPSPSLVPLSKASVVFNHLSAPSASDCQSHPVTPWQSVPHQPIGMQFPLHLLHPPPPTLTPTTLAVHTWKTMATHNRRCEVRPLQPLSLACLPANLSALSLLKTRCPP